MQRYRHDTNSFHKWFSRYFSLPRRTAEYGEQMQRKVRRFTPYVQCKTGNQWQKMG